MSFLPQPCSQHLDCDTDSITVCQGTSPWIVQGVDAIVRDLSCDLDSVTVCQLDLWNVAVTGIVDTRPLDCATDSITVCDPVLQTPAVSSVAGSATAVNLFLANTAAKQRIIHNDSTAILYVKFGAAATVTDYTVRISSQNMFIFPLPLYVGLVTGIWQAATGDARLTEVEL